MPAGLDIKTLRMLVAIDRDGSLTRAAQSLGVTQSALSHHLKETERRTAVELFHRVNKRLHLTAIGEELLQVLDRQAAGGAGPVDAEQDVVDGLSVEVSLDARVLGDSRRIECHLSHHSGTHPSTSRNRPSPSSVGHCSADPPRW